ncbi:hypothetical protein B7494_g4042 [Chlorociboria aeruginascens]|nr:hypothetical protein B7494_g4042 [Chlorociboria aeruginascens]
MPLSFLRPMGLPRSSSIQRFFVAARFSSTTTTTSTTTSSISSPQTPTSVNPPHPYRVVRTPFNGLPIYLLAKRGGNLKQTRLRKIEGDINTLRTELQEALGLEEKEVVINQLTKHIIIRGWRKPEVQKFLEDRKF